MTHFHVRPAVARDIALLPDIEREAAARFPPQDLPAGPAQVTSVAALREGMDDHALWVAEAQGGRLLGFLLGRAEEGSFHILEMDVRTSEAGRGIGSALLQQACAAASRRALKAVTLTTFEHLAWNAPFYAKRGFRPVSDLSAYPHLRGVLQAEARQGFARRVAMVRPAGPCAGEAVE